MNYIILKLGIIFFLSGTSALIFEFLWFRLCGLVFGSSVWAVSIVLASFMGGIALGNGLIAHWGTKVKRPVRLYAFLEIIIGITGFLLVIILPVLSVILISLLKPFLGQTLLLNSLRTIFTILLLILPSTAMGATLPVLVKALNIRFDNFGQVLGFLYGANTLGAVAGVLIADIFIVKWFGIMGSGLFAALFNLTAAVLAIGISKQLDSPQAILDKPVTQETGSNFSHKARRLLSISFFCGFIFLALEVIWFRFMNLLFIGDSMNFSLTMAVVLCGISLGGFAAAKWYTKNKSAHNYLNPLLFSIGIFVIFIYSSLGNYYTNVDSILVNLNLSAWITSVREFLLLNDVPEVLMFSILLTFPVSFISGMLFTFVGKMLHFEIEEETKVAGWVTMTNTIGGMLGSLSAGFILIPFLGIEKSFLLLGSLYGLLSLFNYEHGLKCEDTRRRKFYYFFGISFIVVVISFPIGLMNRYLDVLIANNPILENREKRVAYKEGMNETIQYLRKDIFDKPYYHRLITNSHSMSATKIPSKRYMKLFVYLPIALQKSSKNAALIGFGTGMTAKSLVDTKSLEHIAFVDISKDVFEMSKIVFPNPRENPINDPRVQMHIEDGRFFLLATSRKYDLITGEPPPPTNRGIVSLYTQEYFQLIHDRLNEGGFVSYWLPIHSLNPEGSKSILKAFCNVFENCTLWTGYQRNWMMVGFKKPHNKVSKEDVVRQWQDPIILAEMQAIGIDYPERMGALFIADGKRLRDWIGETEPLVDNYPKRILGKGYGIIQNEYGFDKLLYTKEIQENFLNSMYIADMWPDDGRDNVLPHIPNSQIQIATGYTASPFDLVKKLNDCLVDPLRTDYDLFWYLMSDHDAQSIVNNKLNEMDMSAQEFVEIFKYSLFSGLQVYKNGADVSPVNMGTPFFAIVTEGREIVWHLAAYSIVREDYLTAETCYSIISNISGIQTRSLYYYLRMYLLYLLNKKEGALNLKNEYVQSIEGTQYFNDNDLDSFWQWLQDIPDASP